MEQSSVEYAFENLEVGAPRIPLVTRLQGTLNPGGFDTIVAAQILIATGF